VLVTGRCGCGCSWAASSCAERGRLLLLLPPPHLPPPLPGPPLPAMGWSMPPLLRPRLPDGECRPLLLLPARWWCAALWWPLLRPPPPPRMLPHDCRLSSPLEALLLERL
jgi:hypothetical protein